uniref:Pyroglutamyl-peptidase I n=1 Tax=Gopherus agassizii TaxID=38772 RepID=A0A452I9P5_9SAUR
DQRPKKKSCVGFGPFGEHAVNASWIAVQELVKLGLGDGVDLYVYEIPVEYQTVQRLIPALWKKHSPELVVHVGVSGMATTVTLEKCGHNVGYKGLDNCRFCPGSQCCVEGGPECIDSIIDMDAVCRRVSTLGLDVTVTISKDAGRYGIIVISGVCSICAKLMGMTEFLGLSLILRSALPSLHTGNWGGERTPNFFLNKFNFIWDHKEKMSYSWACGYCMVSLEDRAKIVTVFPFLNVSAF